MRTERTRERANMLYRNRDSDYREEAVNRLNSIIDLFIDHCNSGVKVTVIAEKTGISYGMLHKLRNNGVKVPSFELICTIAMYLNDFNK